MPTSLLPEPVRTIYESEDAALALAEETRRNGGSVSALFPAGIPHLFSNRIKKMAHQEKYENTMVEMTVQVPAWVYGYLCTGAKVHDLASPEEMVREYLERTVVEWTNEEYFLSDY